MLWMVFVRSRLNPKTYGYFGEMLDAVTGLLYVGNGQYYAPATGRFLTREVYPNSANPYAPWNPIGAIVGPLGGICFPLLEYDRDFALHEDGSLLILLRHLLSSFTLFSRF